MYDQEEEKLLGILGLKSQQFSMTKGLSYWSLVHNLGLIDGNRAAFIFALFERTPAPNELVVEALAVSPDHRGSGIGSELLDHAARVAATEGYQRLSLEVVDTNPRARALYEKFGFRKTRSEKVGSLSSELGFSEVFLMSKSLA